ncbi:MAG: LysM peptidoglycan-binding domain-containing protein [Acidobacteria bacterium]|nr:LysM peptidoglycan-binding domain-containing protein [Acidobacteriota bacterium]
MRFFSALFLAIFIFGLTTSSAQSLGDLARQERERVKARPARSSRVYTNEDLARPKILGTLEKEIIGSLAPIASPPATPSSAPAPASEQATLAPVAPLWPAGTPLGDIARYYRQQKQLRVPNLEPPALAQAKNPDQEPEPPSRTPQAPRNAATMFSPPQPLLRPRKIIAITEPSGRENTSTPRVVRVNPGDSLWKIAARYLGDGNQWREIASANPELANPDRIQAGQQIRLPGESATAATAANQVRVQAGDSLWKLAKAQWGNGQAWSCIAESNPQIQDSSRIFPGQTLTLPPSCSPSI